MFLIQVYCGLSVGDVNGDGFDDIVIGALRVYESYSGAAYVVFGGVSGRRVNLDALPSNPQLGYVLTGPPFSWLGYSVCGAGGIYCDLLLIVVILFIY